MKKLLLVSAVALFGTRAFANSSQLDCSLWVGENEQKVVVTATTNVGTAGPLWFSLTAANGGYVVEITENTLGYTSVITTPEKVKVTTYRNFTDFDEIKNAEVFRIERTSKYDEVTLSCYKK